MSVLSDVLNLRDMDWIEAPSIGAEYEDLGIATGAGVSPAPVPGDVDIPPCGMPHEHKRTDNGMWSAGAWLCAIGQLERQNTKTITANLRHSQRFASMRTTGSLVSHPVWLPFLATETASGTVYRRILNGESFIDVAQELGVLS